MCQLISSDPSKKYGASANALDDSGSAIEINFSRVGKLIKSFTQMTFPKHINRLLGGDLCQLISSDPGKKYGASANPLDDSGSAIEINFSRVGKLIKAFN